MNFKKMTLWLLLLAGLVSCTTETKLSDEKIKEQVKKVIKDNPDLVIDVIKENPAKFVQTLQEAVQLAQKEKQKERVEKEKREKEERFSNPFQPLIRKDEAIRGGGKDAPLTLVEYSDFECPFCTRGFKTVQDLMKKYGDKIKFVYKHLPLSFHAQAVPAAKYYEAIRLQSHEKAFKFHDEVFDNQRKLKKGKAFLDSVAKKLGVDMEKLKKDYDSPEVAERIKQDEEEAKKFGMSGTPGFLINGIPVRGAFPASEFVKIIDELKKRGKVSL